MDCSFNPDVTNGRTAEWCAHTASASKSAAFHKILRWKRFHPVRSCNRINAPDGDKELPRSKRIKQLLGARRKNTETYFQ
jgi:hypothetical protein